MLSLCRICTITTTLSSSLNRSERRSGKVGFEAFAARVAEGAQGIGFQEAPLPAAVPRAVDADHEPRLPPASLTLGA